jgi:enoyl-CoA hydratase
VLRGTTRAEAEKLALRIAAFPQVALRSDRRSAYDSFDRDTAAAIRREMELSLEARRNEAQEGAARFSAGAGRGGSFDSEVG